MWESQVGNDCFVYYRVHLNFGTSIPLDDDLEWNYDPTDANHADFIHYSDRLMTLFEEIFTVIEGEQEITPIQIKENKGQGFTDRLVHGPSRSRTVSSMDQ